MVYFSLTTLEGLYDNITVTAEYSVQLAIKRRNTTINTVVNLPSNRQLSLYSEHSVTLFVTTTHYTYHRSILRYLHVNLTEISECIRYGMKILACLFILCVCY